MSDLDDFTHFAERFVSAGMPAIHGISEEEYLTKCRAVWDACETDPDCPYKLLMDRKYPDVVDLFSQFGAHYTDPIARGPLEHAERPGDIYCVAVGQIPLVAIHRGVAAGAVPKPADPDPSDFDLWVVAVLDVLGFERMYGELGPHQMQVAYDRLIATARSNVDTNVIGAAGFADADIMYPSVFHFEVGFTYASDTLVLWAPLSHRYISPFLARCADVITDALTLGIPLRGAIAIGEAILNKNTGVFIGSPLIEAVRLEHAQDWVGLSLAASCRAILPDVDPNLVIPYTPPCKPAKGDQILHAGFAVDWPRRARSRSIDATALLKSLNKSAQHDKYYRNALEFIQHSAHLSGWNRAPVIPFCGGLAVRAVYHAIQDGIPMGDDVQAMLDYYSSRSELTGFHTACLRALAEGKPLPPEPAEAPEWVYQSLKSIQDVVATKGIDLEEIMHWVTEARVGIIKMPARVRDLLYSAEPSANGAWETCRPFLRDVTAGSAPPQQPEGLPGNLAELLRNITDKVLGNTVPVDIEALLVGALWAAASNTQLSAENQHRLRALREAGSAWAPVAVYYEAISQGFEPMMNLDGLPPASASLIHHGGSIAFTAGSEGGARDCAGFPDGFEHEPPTPSLTLGGRHIPSSPPEGSSYAGTGKAWAAGEPRAG